ncbi:MAG: hypothetical protein PGN25_13380 [Methylorubrum populi]
MALRLIADGERGRRDGRHPTSPARPSPARFPLRLLAAILLILGGLFSILPVLGLWMRPLGLAPLAQDVPALKVPMERAACWIERQWRRRRGG